MRSPIRQQMGAWCVAAALGVVGRTPGALAHDESTPPPSPVPASEKQLGKCDPDWSARVVEMQGHRRTAAVTAWLSNGVCVHHMKMELPPGQVVVTINLVGGELLEGAESRGISMAAASAWKNQTIRDGAGEKARRLIQNRDVYVEASSTSLALQLRVWGSREDVEAGMRVVGELLSRPQVDAAAIEDAAKLAGEVQTFFEKSEQGHLRAAIRAAIYPPANNEPRTAPASAARVGALTPESVQKWLDWHIESAPVEAAIVGDLSLEQAMKLAGGFLGKMPKRDRISRQTLGESRKLLPPPLPSEQRIAAETAGGAALAVVGFMGGDEAHPAELRTLQVGARLLNEAVKSALANSGVENTGVGASVVPAIAYPGFGAVIISARVGRADADRAAEVIARTILEYDPEKPKDPFKVERVAIGLANTARAMEDDQRHWSGVLARSMTLGLNVDDLADAPAFFRAINDKAVGDALKQNATPERMFRVVVGG